MMCVRVYSGGGIGRQCVKKRAETRRRRATWLILALFEAASLTLASFPASGTEPTDTSDTKQSTGTQLVQPGATNQHVGDESAPIGSGDSGGSTTEDAATPATPDGSAPKSKADVEDLLFKELPAPVVVSATKTEQPIYEAPSAITVITAEDIRRMGARRLVDVFRWTPGLDVFTTEGNKSGVSARGVYSLHADVVNHMLVLVDGRSVYLDFEGTVGWDALPVFLEEIERIEIIRGPSGTLYGPNAFAGTISIFTKRKPEAGVSRTTIGTNHFFESNLIHWLEGESYELRLGVGWRENEGFGTAGGRDFLDDQNLGKTNLFGHFRLGCDTDLELRGGWTTGNRGFGMGHFDTMGHELTDVGYGQVMLEHRFSEDLRLRTQYFHNQFNLNNHPYANDTRGLVTYTDVVSVEEYWRVHPCHQLIFGGEFRNFVAHSHITEPERVEQNFRSLFAEDDITLIEEKLHLIMGIRYDDFTVSGDDFSPRAALVWTPAPQHSFRASIARAISTPPTILSQLNFEFRPGTFVDVGPPFGLVPRLTHTEGNPGLDPETILAYEVGYRGRWSKKLDVGADGFFYNVDDLIRGASNGPSFFNGDPLDPAFVRPVTFRNTIDTVAYGGELNVTYRWSDCLTTFVGYSYKEIPNVESGSHPQHAGFTNFKRSVFGAFDWRITNTCMLSSRAAWTDEFAPFQEMVFGDYLRLDLRLAKTFWDGCGTIELIGHNLLEPRHPEGADVEVDRMVFLAVEVRY